MLVVMKSGCVDWKQWMEAPYNTQPMGCSSCFSSGSSSLSLLLSIKHLWCINPRGGAWVIHKKVWDTFRRHTKEAPWLYSDPYHTPHVKINSRWRKEFNIKERRKCIFFIKALKKLANFSFHNYRVNKDFLISNYDTNSDLINKWLPYLYKIQIFRNFKTIIMIKTHQEHDQCLLGKIY